MNDIQGVIEVLTEFSSNYKRVHLNPFNPWFEKNSGDENEMLKYFVLRYALARQGAPKSYNIIGLHLLEKNSLNWVQYESFFEWSDDETHRKTNKNANPFYSDDEKRNVLDIWGKVWEPLKIIIGKKGNLLAPTQEVYEKLCEIRGVGGKIAALFLRDIFLILGMDEKIDKKIISYTFPVDVWIRNLIDRLSREKYKDIKVDKQDTEKKFIVQKLQEGWQDMQRIEWARLKVKFPLRFNAGAWYYLSNVAGTEKYLKDRLLPEGKEQNWVANLKDAAKRISVL